MDNSKIWNCQISFAIARGTKELLKNLIFSKFSNDPKNVSSHCGGHYNLKYKHFKDFSGGAPGAPPHDK